MDRNIVNVDKNVSCDDFQAQVEDVLIRHRSILDIITKLNEYTSRIDRAVVKSVTYCGCIEIHATKQDYNRESLEEIKNNMQNHVKGKLCPSCKEVLEEEIGAYIFYLSALCNALDINLSEAILKEYGNMKTLGIFSLK